MGVSVGGADADTTEDEVGAVESTGLDDGAGVVSLPLLVSCTGELSFGKAEGCWTCKSLSSIVRVPVI